MDRHMFQFGGGARTCVGKNVRIRPHSLLLLLTLLRRSPFVKCTKLYHKFSVLTISHSSMARRIGRHIIIGSTKRVVWIRKCKYATWMRLYPRCKGSNRRWISIRRRRSHESYRSLQSCKNPMCC
jgi:hypothetical protein